MECKRFLDPVEPASLFPQSVETGKKEKERFGRTPLLIPTLWFSRRCRIPRRHRFSPCDSRDWRSSGLLEWLSRTNFLHFVQKNTFLPMVHSHCQDNTSPDIRRLYFCFHVTIQKRQRFDGVPRGYQARCVHLSDPQVSFRPSFLPFQTKDKRQEITWFVLSFFYPECGF